MAKVLQILSCSSVLQYSQVQEGKTDRKKEEKEMMEC